MPNQYADVEQNSIVDSMNHAFGESSFYGLEYVLDEWQRDASVNYLQNISLAYLDFFD